MLLTIAFFTVTAPGCIINRELLSAGQEDGSRDARGVDAPATDAPRDAGMQDMEDAGADAMMVDDTGMDAGLPDAYAVLPDAYAVLPDASACVARAETCNGRDDDCDGAADDDACRVGSTMCTAFTVADHVYQYCRVTRSRDAAASACAGLPDYTLVRIESAAENAALRSEVTSTVWTQLNDRTMEGSFRFDDGSTASYFQWGPDEPNNMASGPGEDCVTLYPSGDWNDARCSESEDVLCERATLP